MYSTYLYRTAQVRFSTRANIPCANNQLARKPKNKPRTDRLKGNPAHRIRNTELKILEINARGLRANTGELANLCHAKQHSIVIIVATFLDPTVPDGDDSIAIPVYCLCCKDKLGTPGEGIAVYCLEGIAVHHDPRGDPQHLELFWFTVALQSQKLLIGAVYRPPSANNDISEYLDVKITECGAESILLIGDFNVHHKHWLRSRTTDNAAFR